MPSDNEPMETSTNGPTQGYNLSESVHRALCQTRVMQWLREKHADAHQAWMRSRAAEKSNGFGEPRARFVLYPAEAQFAAPTSPFKTAVLPDGAAWRPQDNRLTMHHIYLTLRLEVYQLHRG